MKVCRALAVAAGIVIPQLAFAQHGIGSAGLRDYSAAVFATGAYGMDEQNLTVFPFNGEAFSIHLPLPLGRFALSADGKVLYAQAGAVPRGERAGPTSSSSPVSPQLQRIEFNPTRLSPVAGSAGLGQIHSLAVSRLQDKIIVSVGYPYFGDVGCGIFELSLPDGKVRRVLENIDCPPGLHSYLSAWLMISLAPNGNRAVAIRKHRLELIDLSAATVRVLGNGFEKAAWSPDGKWIAALEYRAKRWRTVLMDSATFVRRRTLSKSNVEWSPDSRYLLASQEDSHCEYNLGTLEAIDIENGSKTTIDSSTCRVSEVTAAWVSSEVFR